MARPNPLADPEFAQAVAEAFAEGLSRREIAATFNIRTYETVSRWRRDPRVKMRVMKIIEDRILEITRKTDSAIAARLQNTADLTVKEILDIRREFLGGALRSKTEQVDDEVIGETMEAMENNPEMIEQLKAVLAGSKKQE